VWLLLRPKDLNPATPPPSSSPACLEACRWTTITTQNLKSDTGRTEPLRATRRSRLHLPYAPHILIADRTPSSRSKRIPTCPRLVSLPSSMPITKSHPCSHGSPFVDYNANPFVWNLSPACKARVRIPARLPDRYFLSILAPATSTKGCARTVNRIPRQLPLHPRYELFEWDLVHTFTNAEMAPPHLPGPFRWNADTTLRRRHQRVGLYVTVQGPQMLQQLCIGETASESEWFEGPPHDQRHRHLRPPPQKHLNLPRPEVEQRPAPTPAFFELRPPAAALWTVGRQAGAVCTIDTLRCSSLPSPTTTPPYPKLPQSAGALQITQAISERPRPLTESPPRTSQVHRGLVELHIRLIREHDIVPHEVASFSRNQGTPSAAVPNGLSHASPPANDPSPTSMSDWPRP